MDNLQDIIDSIQNDGERSHGGDSSAGSSNKSKSNNNGGGGGKEKLCKKCHQPGHFANKCPVVSEKKKAKMKCYICGQSGHNRNACPGVDDGGAAQSIHKGNSTAKNNTGEKKKKGKDKVRAQKMMRGKKKERGQSIDEKESSAIVFPESSIPYHDMLSGVLNDVDEMDEEDDDETHPSASALLAGFISPCTPSHETSYAMTFDTSVPEDSYGLMGYAVSLPPRSSSQWLRHIELNNGEDVVLKDMLDKLGPKVRAFGPIGLDYRDKVLKHNSHDDQREVFRRMVSLATESSAVTGGASPQYILITAVAPEVSTSTENVFKIDDEGMNESDHGLNIDKDLFKVLYDIRLLQESPLSIVISLADCGLKYSTIEALLSAFPNVYFSLDGRLTHSKRKMVKEYAFDIPLSRLVFASMAPQYPVAPSCLGGVSIDSAKSVHLLFVADALATIKNISLTEVMEKCLDNSNRILGLI